MRLKSLLTPHFDRVSRAVAAAVGGYALATLLPLALVGLFPISRAEVVMIAMQLSFAIYLLAILWVYAVPSARLAWVGLLIPIALSAVVVGLQRVLA